MDKNVKGPACLDEDLVKLVFEKAKYNIDPNMAIPNVDKGSLYGNRRGSIVYAAHYDRPVSVGNLSVYEDIETYEMKLKVATEIHDKVDDSILKTLYELYHKCSDVNSLYVIDEGEFKKFLKTCLPIYDSIKNCKTYDDTMRELHNIEGMVLTYYMDHMHEE